jgi:hypothetical protein
MTRLKKHHSLIRAEKVLARANALGFSKFAAEKFTVYVWDNCREQGLVIKAMLVVKKAKPTESRFRSPAVFVAKCRISDDTLVVVDEVIGFLGRNMPSDSGWETGRKYFHEDEIEKAARHLNKAVNALAAKYKKLGAI